MSDPLRTDGSRTVSAAPDADRELTIEHLLLTGLDQYFASQYEQAIHVWTRVLFLDRSHARARAYIERARSALAERQRESEELLQTGMAAVERGDSGEARRLLGAAIDSGAHREEAQTALDRLNRLAPTPSPQQPSPAPRASGRTGRSANRPAMLSAFGVVMVFVLAVVSAGIYSAIAWGPLDWRSIVSLEKPAARPTGAAVARTVAPPLPREGELALLRARAFVAEGRLRDALLALERVRSTDAERPDADRLRGDIQRQLIAIASGALAPSDGAPAGRRAP